MCDRPNIVYLMTDQQSSTAMSCAGNPHLHTPALDALAARGTRFNAAYTSFPLCVPARTSMLTGRMSHEAGVIDNYPDRRAGLPFPMLGRLLADAGYECHYIGKWHIPSVAEEDTATHGFDEIVFGGGYGGLDHEKTAAALDFLAKPHDRPFFLVVSYNNPHDCCELSRDQELRMGAIPPPPGPDGLPPLPENHAIPDGEPDVIRHFQRRMNIFRAKDWDERKTREYLWGYYRLVEKVDAEIGRTLGVLTASGLADNTVVLFASDHGDGHGCHRWNQKWTLYDESARVPFIVAAPGGADPGGVCERPASAMLDLMPTILDYAGVTPPEICHGESVRPLVEGTGVPGRDFVACETYLDKADDFRQGEHVPGRMVRTERYKYVAFAEGEPREQLTDMQADPGEMHNLAGDPAHQEDLERHHALLRGWCKRTGDPFRLTEVDVGTDSSSTEAV